MVACVYISGSRDGKQYIYAKNAVKSNKRIVTDQQYMPYSGTHAL